MPGWLLKLAFLSLLAFPAAAQDFPKLTGRVVDQANLISPAIEAELDAKLHRLEDETTRQLVVVTVSDLHDYPIEDYGYRLGRAWGIGQKGENNGALFIVAPVERKVRIEVGYGLEAYLTDAWSSILIARTILPRFKAGDMEGGIVAGVDELVAQLALPPEEARANLAAAREAKRRDAGGRGFGLVPMLFMIWFVIWMLRGIFGGKRHGKKRGLWGAPVILWGSGLGGRSSGGFGGGFSGGGGSFGGGGASGSW